MALWKFGGQEGNNPSGSLLVNFWQTPFVIGPMVCAYLVTDNVKVARFIRRTGNTLKFGAKSYPPSQRAYYTSAPENLRLVDYVTLIDGSTYAADGVGPERTLSVAGAMAWAYYFSKITQRQDDTLKRAANELYRTSTMKPTIGPGPPRRPAARPRIATIRRAATTGPTRPAAVYRGVCPTCAGCRTDRDTQKNRRSCEHDRPRRPEGNAIHSS